MRRVVLFHWSRPECAERLARLRAAGFEGSAVIEGGSPEWKAALASSPDAFVIDLARLPSHGKAVAFALRAAKRTRQIPIVFIEGDPEKTAALRRFLPDAAYTAWDRVGPALREAIAHPPENPLSPESSSGTAAGTPLPKKLGVKPGTVVALLGAPGDFVETLGALPSGASVVRGRHRAADLTLWFIGARADLRRDLRRLAPRAAGGGLWICWRKKSSGIVTDVGEREIREAALAAGLVDFKICSVNATWSGLRFSVRTGDSIPARD